MSAVQKLPAPTNVVVTPNAEGHYILSFNPTVHSDEHTIELRDVSVPKVKDEAPLLWGDNFPLSAPSDGSPITYDLTAKMESEKTPVTLPAKHEIICIVTCYVGGTENPKESEPGRQMFCTGEAKAAPTVETAVAAETAPTGDEKPANDGARDRRQRVERPLGSSVLPPTATLENPAGGKKHTIVPDPRLERVGMRGQPSHEGLSLLMGIDPSVVTRVTFTGKNSAGQVVVPLKEMEVADLIKQAKMTPRGIACDSVRNIIGEKGAALLNPAGDAITYTAVAYSSDGSHSDPTTLECDYNYLQVRDLSAPFRREEERQRKVAAKLESDEHRRATDEAIGDLQRKIGFLEEKLKQAATKQEVEDIRTKLQEIKRDMSQDLKDTGNSIVSQLNNAISSRIGELSLSIDDKIKAGMATTAAPKASKTPQAIPSPATADTTGNPKEYLRKTKEAVAELEDTDTGRRGKSSREDKGSHFWENPGFWAFAIVAIVMGVLAVIYSTKPKEIPYDPNRNAQAEHHSHHDDVVRSPRGGLTLQVQSAKVLKGIPIAETTVASSDVPKAGIEEKHKLSTVGDDDIAKAQTAPTKTACLASYPAQREVVTQCGAPVYIERQEWGAQANVSLYCRLGSSRRDYPARTQVCTAPPIPVVREHGRNELASNKRWWISNDLVGNGSRYQEVPLNNSHGTRKGGSRANTASSE